MPLSQRVEQIDAQAARLLLTVIIRRVDNIGKVLVRVDVAFPGAEVFFCEFGLVKMEIEVDACR